MSLSSEDRARIQVDLIAATGGMNGPDTDMLGAIERLDRLVQERREDLDLQLLHFLERRSYAKALEFLGGGRPAVGACGGQPRRVGRS